MHFKTKKPAICRLIDQIYCFSGSYLPLPCLLPLPFLFPLPFFLFIFFLFPFLFFLPVPSFLGTQFGSFCCNLSRCLSPVPLHDCGSRLPVKFISAAVTSVVDMDAAAKSRTTSLIAKLFIIIPLSLMMRFIALFNIYDSKSRKWFNLKNKRLQIVSPLPRGSVRHMPDEGVVKRFFVVTGIHTVQLRCTAVTFPSCPTSKEYT